MSPRRFPLLRCAAIAAICVVALVAAGTGSGSRAVPASPRTAAVPTSQVSDPGGSGMKAAEMYGRLPLTFEANRGQTDSRVKYVSRGKGYTLFLTNSQAVLSMGTSDQE